MATTSSEETAGELRSLLHQFAHRDESDEDVKSAPFEHSSPSPSASASASPTSAQVVQAAPSAVTSTSNQTLESESASASASAAATASSQPLPSGDEPLAVSSHTQHAGTKRAAANAASTSVEGASEETETASAPSNCKVARDEGVGGGDGFGVAVGEEHWRDRDRAADDESPSKAISPTHQPQTSTVLVHICSSKLELVTSARNDLPAEYMYGVQYVE